MRDKFEYWRNAFYLRIMSWAGSKIWPYVTIFSNTEDVVLAMHFARDETALVRSMSVYLEEAERESKNVSVN